MKALLDNILHTPDREKRNYLWLSFLKNTETCYRKLELSPSYRLVKSAYQNMQDTLTIINNLKHAHKELKGLDMTLGRALYSSKIYQEDIDYWLEDLEKSYLPSSKQKIDEFRELKEFVYSMTAIEPIGIESLYRKEGYVILKYKDQHESLVYRYNLSTYTNEEYRRKVYLKPITQFRFSLTCSFRDMKNELNKMHSNFHLNTYLMECALNVPYETTFLPITKGKLCRYLTEE